jgi:hypothetical protein
LATIESHRREDQINFLTSLQSGVAGLTMNRWHWRFRMVVGSIEFNRSTFGKRAGGFALPSAFRTPHKLALLAVRRH